MTISVDACCWDFLFPKLCEGSRAAPKADYVLVPVLRAEDTVVNKIATIPVPMESIT